MEKKRVRIYKAGGQQGSYINKTARYFQDGGMQMQEEVVPEEQPMQEPNDEQVIEFIMQTLSQPNGSIEQAKQQLVQANVHPARVTQLSDVALEYINQQQDLELANETGQEDEAAALQAEQDAYDQAAADEEQALQEQAQLQEMYNQSAEGVEGISEDDPTNYMRKGGMLSKRAYISNFIKLAKKQEGGDTEKPKTDIKTDIPIKGRVEKVGKFLNALTVTANNAALKKQAEDSYNQQMQGFSQEGGDIESGVSNFDPYHNLEHYSGAFEHSMPFNELTEAQFGGWGQGQGRERRAARRMNRMMPQGFNPMGNQMASPFMQNQMSTLSQFMPNQGNLGLANIDVRRTGMFGRPKEYTINFNSSTPVKPQDIEDNKKQEVNNADEIVKDAEADIKAEANNTSTEKNIKVLETAVAMPTVEDISVVDKTVRNNSGRNIPGTPSNEPSVSSSIPGMVTDQWGRPKGDKWYGFNPDTKKFDDKKSVAETVIDKANKYSIDESQNPDSNFQYLEGKPYQYTRFDDQWNYQKINDDTFKEGEGIDYGVNQYPVTNQKTLDRLNQGPMSGKGSKGNTLVKLPSKPGYYYRIKNDGSYEKFKGKPDQHSYKSKPIGTIKKGDPNYNYLDKNSVFSTDVLGKKMVKPANDEDVDYSMFKMGGNNMPFQQGGFVDPESGLYKFMSGGEDMSQMDLDFSNSKNISSPYFEDGGYMQKGGHWNSEGVWIEGLDPRDVNEVGPNSIKKEVKKVDDKAVDATVSNQNPVDYAQQYLQSMGMRYNPFSPGQAITAGGNWNKAMGKAYDTQTGNPISGMIGPNAQVRNIKVDKVRKFGPNKGAAKKFTVNYNVPGETGINATGTPQSYKGADGQMHWMANPSQSSQGEAGRKRPVADMLLRSKIPGLQQLGAKMTPWEGGNPSEPMSGFHDKSDEAYKEHFGHYPGEGKTEYTEVGALPTRKNVREEPQLVQPTVGTLPIRKAQQLENFIQRPEIEMEPAPLAPSTPITELGPINSAGPMVSEQDMQENTQTEFDLPQSESMDYMQSQLYNAPNEYDNYNPYISNQEEAAQYFNENLRGPGYMPENALLNMEHFDSSNDIVFSIDPITKQPVRVNRNRSNVNRGNVNQPNVNRNTPNQPVVNNRPANTPSSNNQQTQSSQYTPEQQRQLEEFKRKNKEDAARGRHYTTVSGSDPFYNASEEELDADIDRITKAQQNTVKGRQDFKKEYGIDRPTLEMYLSLQGQPQALSMEKMYPNLRAAASKYNKNKSFQNGGYLPKAQFGPTGERQKAPLGYYDNPNRSGLTTNMAGDVYSPKTNLQGNADKLMENPFIQQGNGLTTDNSMGFNAEGTGYRNEGLLSDKEKEQQASKKVSQKFKNKQEWDIDAQMALEGVNQFGNALAGFGERAQDALQNRNIGSKFDASNMFATTSDRYKGGYDQLGQFKPNETGFKKPYSYGGYMEEGGSYEEGGDTWMSEEQIQRFLAEGGELEFV